MILKLKIQFHFNGECINEWMNEMKMVLCEIFKATTTKLMYLDMNKWTNEWKDRNKSRREKSINM